MNIWYPGIRKSKLKGIWEGEDSGRRKKGTNSRLDSK